MNTVQERYLARAILLCGCSQADLVASSLWAARLKPDVMAEVGRAALQPDVRDVIVAGTFERRVLLFQRDEDWVAVSPQGKPLANLPWPPEVSQRFADADEPIATVSLSEREVFLLTRPRVVIVGLYHREVFPLPRFPLGISDLARAVRSTMVGQVHLLDMQLGLSVDDVQTELTQRAPDIVGVSATFGQNDVLEAMMDAIQSLPKAPLVAFGGSLSALNSALLLERFPDALVCNGPGELMMQDCVSHWHQFLPKSDIRFASGAGLRILKKRQAPLNRDYEDVVPELDLLDATLAAHGVMQLESSRGCTHACSFCPRSHKGRWSGYAGDIFSDLLTEVRSAYDDRPGISRKIFLVDEEFVGSDTSGSAVERAAGIATRISDAGFRWETSTRVDQVARPDRDESWHVDRIRFWRDLRDKGLSRCLFGVESGVDSILRRFNKHSTSDQNARALRTLTSLSVPIRCTYITFDQLMTMDELVATYRFLGREDLLLKPAGSAGDRDLYDLLQDPGYVQRAQQAKPFYEAVSYMLVSMEALIGSPYLRLLEQDHLAGATDPSMGRRMATFKIPEIGQMSDASQRWVDRNFSFDYTLKSLEKVSEGKEQEALRGTRALLKRSSYHLLGRMLAGGLEDPTLVARADPAGQSLAALWQGNDWVSRERFLSDSFALLVDEIDVSVSYLEELLTGERQQILGREHASWRMRTDWALING